jgi:hypothetical protein
MKRRVYLVLTIVLHMLIAGMTLLKILILAAIGTPLVLNMGITDGFERPISLLNVFSWGQIIVLVAIIVIHRIYFLKDEASCKDFLISVGVPAAVFVPLFAFFFWSISH